MSTPAFNAMAPGVTKAEVDAQLRAIVDANVRSRYADRAAADTSEMKRQLDAADAERARRAAASAARLEADSKRRARR